MLLSDNLRVQVETLCSDAEQSVLFIGYLDAIVDNPTVELKSKDSFSGYALATAKVGVKTSLIAYCARAWDEDNDACSIPSIVKKLGEQLARNNNGQSCPRYAEINQEAKKTADAFRKSNLDLFRTEQIAHLVLQSRDRQRKLKENLSTDYATWRELINLSIDSVKLVDRIRTTFIGGSELVTGRISRTKSNCLAFWEALPVLRDCEIIRHSTDK